MCVCVFVFSGSRLLQPAHVCDILKALILLLSFSMTHYLDYAMMYHLIRGQSVIKLYIIYNMLEVTQLLDKAQKEESEELEIICTAQLTSDFLQP